ncbi:MAG: hypothetical protein JXJ17_00785 [Anaerolineae bacterium]|nr:hypothetical protein [Anaerolineae bacterium]
MNDLFQDILEKVKSERRERLEFLIVVIVVGLVLNIFASALWETIVELEQVLRWSIVLAPLLLSLLSAVFTIYFNPEKVEKRRFYGYYDLLPSKTRDDDFHTFEVIMENSLSSGPVLNSVNQFLNRNYHLDELASGDNSTEKMIEFLGGLFLFTLIEPLVQEFQIRWSHHQEMQNKWIPILDHENNQIGMLREELLGGRVFMVRELCNILLSSGFGKFLDQEHNNSTLLALASRYYLKLPPETDVSFSSESGKYKFSLHNKYVKTTFQGSFVLSKVSPGPIVRTCLSYVVTVEFSLLSKFRSDYVAYLIWTKRMLNCLDNYFNSPYVDMSSEQKEDDINLVVGNKQNMKYYIQSDDTAATILEIPKSERVLFRSEEMAKNAGYESKFT